MGEFNNWSIQDLMILVASLRFTYERAESDGNEIVMDDIQSVMDKIKPILETKLKEMQEFGELIESCLEDVALASEIIVRNPNAEIPEYN